MRSADARTGSLFSYVGCGARGPANHPLRLIHAKASRALSGELGWLYARVGHPSTAPEEELRVWLLQAFSARSERQLMEQHDINLLSGTSQQDGLPGQRIDELARLLSSAKYFHGVPHLRRAAQRDGGYVGHCRENRA